MSGLDQKMSREFRGRVDVGDFVGVLSCQLDITPESAWQRLSSPDSPLRIPIGEGEGVGSAYSSDMARGKVTACDAPSAFGLSLTYRACRAECAVTLSPLPNGNTSLRVECRFRAYSRMWWAATREGAFAMLQWEILFVELIRNDDTPARGSDALLAERMASDAGKMDFVRSVESWWRATIAAGVDDGIAAFESNHLTRQILQIEDLHPQVETMQELRTQGAVRHYLQSATSEVRAERDRCCARLLAQVGDILNVARMSRGEDAVTIEWDLDERLFLPFRWIVERESIARFLGSPHVPYRVVGVTEYQLVRGRFKSGTFDVVSDAPRELVLPIRQVGRVVRDEGAGLDRALMSWSIPREQVDLVEFDYTASSTETILRATDEGAKVVVNSHLGLADEVYECEVHPESIREYPIPSPAD